MMQLFLVGGFLGSGKTTAIATACKILSKESTRVAVITNDHGSQLVDAAFVKSLNISAREVKSGCFCCNYEQFSAAIEDVKGSMLEIVFAEAVGSCADLIATIVKPMRRFNPAIGINLSVFADGPVLLSSLEGRSSFISDDIQYIYRKQLEEAAILIVNKSDLLNEQQKDSIRLMLENEYPGKKLLFQDSHDQEAVKKWLDAVKTMQAGHFQSLKIDYERYARGEAALGWLDARVSIHVREEAITRSFEFIDEMVGNICALHMPIGHLKFMVDAAGWHQKISFTACEQLSVNGNTGGRTFDWATVLINARVEADPTQLKRIFYEGIRKIEAQNCYVEVLSIDSFRPGYPKPTHRLA